MALLALMSSLVVPLSIFGLIFWFCKKLMDRRNQPPGPLGLPIIGYLPFLTTKEPRHILFNKLGEKYGPIFQFQSGENTLVVLNTAEAMKEAFKLADFQYRPSTLQGIAVVGSGQRNISFANGERWRFCRRLANRALPIFTNAKHSRLEPNTYLTSDWLCKKLLTGCSNGQSVSTAEPLMSYTGSIMSSIIFGQLPEPEGKFVKWLGVFGTEFFDASQSAWLAEIFPSLTFLIKKHTDRMLAVMCYLVENLRELMREHEYTGAVATVSDSFKKACEEISDEEKAQMGMTDSDINDSVLEMFDAGYFTTAENLEWLFLVLATHPVVQAKIQNEIDSMITEKGKPTIKDDWPTMTYCRATVVELVRYTTNMPIGLSHTCLKDVSFGGFLIPKGSLIHPNQYAINHDPALFPDPDSFKPERFIRADGTFNQEESEKIVSFSNGKRRCPGELLAKQNLFLSLVYVMARVNVRLDMNSFERNPLLGDGSNGITFSAGKHKLIFTERKHE